MLRSDHSHVIKGYMNCTALYCTLGCITTHRSVNIWVVYTFIFFPRKKSYSLIYSAVQMLFILKLQQQVKEEERENVN